jgi:hypothetical protein
VSDVDDPLAVRLLYSPHTPHPPQHAFLLLDDLEVFEAFYGGAGGGGKSDALLMAALRYVDVPGYNALILRRTFADLNLPSAIMHRARQWLAPHLGTGPGDVRWVERDFRFTFPTWGAPATLSFGYLQTSADKYRYASAEFQFVGFDELTHFAEDDYSFLFTRIRKPAEPDQPPEDDTLDQAAARALSRVPLRMRSASNPGSRGHLWVRRRLVERRPRDLVDGEAPDPQDTAERAARRVFIPAKLDDNPNVDPDSYREGLAAVDPYVRAQILEGDWYARQPGDWVYDHHHLAAAFALGDELDEELARGTIAPPAGGLLAIGLDWGEHTHGLIGWPLEAGGLYVVGEYASTSGEPGEVTAHIVGRRRRKRPRGRGPDEEDDSPVTGILDVVVELGTRERAGDLVPPLGRFGGDPLELVDDHRFDAAGVQSMRTYMAKVRLRHRRARSTAVPFGAPAPQSGKASSPKSYKAETIGHLRTLARRAGEGKRTRVLAIGRRCPELRRQLPALEWADREAGKVKKGDDHGPDALIALDAPLAIRGRAV